MNIAIKYDCSTYDFSVSSEHFKVISPPLNDKSSQLNLHDLLFAKLDNPICCRPFKDILFKSKKILLVVSDATRKFGFDYLSSHLSSYFEKYTQKGVEIKIIISTGIHREPTKEEIEWINRGFQDLDIEIVIHHANVESEMVDLGYTSFGNNIKLNKTLLWADTIVIWGGIGFHYFAGFSGGRKSIMPGLAWAQTVKFNHKLVFWPEGSKRNPCVRTASLKENPVHLDMMESMKFVGLEKIFLINTLLSVSGDIDNVVCGHPVLSHENACQQYLNTHKVLIDRPVDIVIASAGGYPRDINVIQAHKSIEMASYGLKEGGSMLIFAACREGMGHPDFFPWFRFSTLDDFYTALFKNYVVNGQTALSLFEKAKRFKIFLVSDLLKKDVRCMGLTPVNMSEKAVHLALEGMSPNYKGIILPDAANTFCLISDKS